MELSSIVQPPPPPPLPPQLSPGYQPPVPPQIQPPAATPASTPPVPGGDRPIGLPRDTTVPLLPQPPQPTTPQPPAPQQTASIQTDLVRDPTGRNNPGNIRIPGATGPAGFQTYPTMQAGVQALQNNLLTYQDQYGLNTIERIITRWSPPNENNTEELIQKASASMGIDRNQRIDLHDPATMTRMTNAILSQEQSGTRGSGPGGIKLPQPQQRMLTPERRDAVDWGHPPPVSGQMPGAPVPESEWARVLNTVSPLLLAIGSIALRLPLSSAITAYGAMSRAQYNGQRDEYERSRTQFQDKLNESNAQQTLESKEASDAFDTYGQNNPQGLQQRLMQIALTYNDPSLYTTAAKGDLNGAYKLQADRDLHNQSLTKVNDAVRKQRDEQAQDAAVKALDQQWHDEFVKTNGREPTADETAIAHNQHIGEAARAGTKDPKGTKPEQEGEVRNVLDKDGNRIRQVREGKTGGLFDLNGNPTTIDEKAGETLEQPGRAGSSGRDATEGDYTWTNPDGSKGEGFAKVKGKQLVDAVTDEPIPIKSGTRVNKISTQAASQAGNAARGSSGPIQDWEGMKEGLPPPGVSNEDWVQAQDWARMGRAPVGLSSRTSAYQGAHDALPYALHALGKTGADMPGDAVDYETRRTASTSTERYFASGMGARQLTALDTVAAHIQLFREYAAAVKNGNTVLINEVAGRLATATGSPELIDMGIAATITGDEVIRLLTQTGGSRGDREDIKQKLSVYSSPEQFEGIANTLTNFVRERYDPLKQQYTNRLGATPEQKTRYEEAFKNKLTPAAREIGETKAPIAGADVPSMTEQQYNAAPSGARYRMPNDPPGTVRVKP